MIYNFIIVVFFLRFALNFFPSSWPWDKFWNGVGVQAGLIVAIVEQDKELYLNKNGAFSWRVIRVQFELANQIVINSKGSFFVKMALKGLWKYLLFDVYLMFNMHAVIGGSYQLNLV